MEIKAVASLKGGCGKTSLAVFLCQSMLKYFNKILCIDSDLNNNLTDYFLRDTPADTIESRNLYHIITGKKNPNDCIHSTQMGIDIIPATPNLARIEIELARDPGALLRFPTFLHKLDYDLVIIDTPPSLSFALCAALYAASTVLCPISWNRWTLQGYSLLEEECNKAADGLGDKKNLIAIPSMVTENEAAKLCSINKWNISNSYISRNTSVRNAGASGNALKENSKSWIEFSNLAQEISK
jgi:chromosome partitioning protein